MKNKYNPPELIAESTTTIQSATFSDPFPALGNSNCNHSHGDEIMCHGTHIDKLLLHSHQTSGS